MHTWSWSQMLGPSSKPQGQEPTCPPSSPTKATTDPNDGSCCGNLKEFQGSGQWEQCQPQSGLIQLGCMSRENVVDSHMESASRDCFMCLDIDEVTIRTTYKKYRKEGTGFLWPRQGQPLVWGSTQAVLATATRPCVGTWPWDHQNSVGSHSSGRS